MDKISGILPSTARVTSVDLKDAPPSRAVNPGLAKVETLNRLQPADMLAAAPSWKTKEDQHASIVTDVASSFFMKNKSEPEISKEEAPLAQPEGLFPKGSFIDRNA